MTETPVSSVDHHEIAAGLERLISLLRLLSPSGGVSLTTASTLYRLATAGPGRLSDLAIGEGVTQPAMTQLVSRLERQGLAERRDHPDDRRVVMVHITEAGLQMLRHRQQYRAAQLTDLLAALPPEDERSIMAALPALTRLIDLGTSSGRL
ncbi:MarR family winged helix-turn-helix transcriptional regulator [Pseudonocardia spinosispora]|uniref:MarR family winged helix-turn-helix transcriptional regulator n=1 Tax=Pseudonocardia spinosispora TaxID=103441 RepID=UPI0003F7EBCE|nr:MarR family transcriptional regulator [Pseudonocardia spinosispora]